MTARVYGSLPARRRDTAGELCEQLLFGHLEFGLEIVAWRVFDREARALKDRAVNVVDFLERSGSDEDATRHCAESVKGPSSSAIKIQNRVPLCTNLRFTGGVESCEGLTRVRSRERGENSPCFLTIADRGR